MGGNLGSLRGCSWRACGVAVALVASASSVGIGQCVQWVEQNSGPGVSHEGNAVTTWDPDGAGPQLPQVVVGGRLWLAGGVGVDNVALWDGTNWQRLGGGFQFEVTSLCSWDADGPGPQPARLIAGSVYAFGSQTVRAWDGATWQTMGAGPNNHVYSLTSWDPDGEGPLTPRLVAGGVFNAANDGAVPNRVAVWDGVSWQGLGTGMDGWAERVRAVTSWDPDGAGPLPPRLVAAGYFTVAGGVAVKNVAKWDGVAWSAMGDGLGVGFDNEVEQLTTWDPDGPGPLPALLVASGTFLFSGSRAVERLAWWDGSLWQPFPAGLLAAPNVIGSWDADGEGPLLPVLVAGGGRVGTTEQCFLSRWDGAAWQTIGAAPATGAFDAVAFWDPDGSGPLHSQPVVTGRFTEVGTVRLNNVGRFDGAQWQPLGLGTDGTIKALVDWDPDGVGPQSARVVAGGDMDVLGGSVVNGVSSWNGTRWEVMQTGMNGPVSALVSWTPPGGSALAVAGGAFTVAGGVSARSVAAWNGVSWSPLGEGLATPVVELVSWDPDGGGPEGARLIGAGAAKWVVDHTESQVNWWDGSVWRSMGAPLASHIAGFMVMDADGDGPGAGELYVCGSLNTSGGWVKRWNGAAWVGVGGAFNNHVRAMTVWRPDAGPPRLVAGGDFTGSNGGAALSRIAQWNGTFWQPVGVGFNDYVSSLAVWDFDGSGPQPAQLVAAGRFSRTGTVTCRYLAVYNVSGGGAWRELSSSSPMDLSALLVHETGVPGFGAHELFVGNAGGRLLSFGALPVIASQTSGARVCAAAGGSSPVTVTAEVLSAATPTRRWQVRHPAQSATWVDVVDGVVTVGGSTLATASGAGTAVLTLTDVRVPAGAASIVFRLRATTTCGSVLSGEVPVFHDAADIGAAGGIAGHDGVRDNNDFIAFVNAFFMGLGTADVGKAGGVAGSDGLLNNNDFIAFIDLFFADC